MSPYMPNTHRELPLKKNHLLEMQRHQSGVGWVGAAVQPFWEIYASLFCTMGVFFQRRVRRNGI